MLHVTRDMWHGHVTDVTRDTWHVTCWGVNILKIQLPSFTVCDLWYYEYLEEEGDDLINQLMNDEAVKNGPATPGLFNLQYIS